MAAMINIPLFLLIFSGLSIVYFLVGWYASRTVTTEHDYFLAGRNLGFFTLTFTLIATQLGGGMLIGTAREAYTKGLYGISYVTGMSLGFLLLGMGLASKLRALNIATTAELFEKKYHSIRLKKLASLLSIATMCGLLVAQIVASRTLLAGLGIESNLLFVGFWSFIIAYTIAGGLRAVALTDAVQVGVIIVVFFGIFIASIFAQPYSLLEFFTRGQAMMPPLSTISWDKLLPTVLMPALFSIIEQDLAQRFFAARTQHIARWAALASCAFMMLFALVPIYFGVKARMIGLDVPVHVSPLVPVLEYVTNDLWIALALCGIIAAITSTADSLLCAISSNIAQDFEWTWIRTHVPSTLTFAKITTLLTGVIALGASYWAPNNVIDIIVRSYEISVSCLFIPLFACFFINNPSRNAARGAVCAGIIGFCWFLFYPVPFFELITVALSGGGYLAGLAIDHFAQSAKNY